MMTSISFAKVNRIEPSTSTITLFTMLIQSIASNSSMGISLPRRFFMNASSSLRLWARLAHSA